MKFCTSTQRGFTLIELLVVFAIAGSIATLIPMAFDKYREATQYKNTVRELILGLRTARMMASSTGTETMFQIDLDRRTYGVKGGVEHSIPNTVAIRAIVADVEQALVRGLAVIVFQPTGGASGGSFDVIKKNGTGTRVRVDWLTSKLDLEPVAQ